jgi:hypothetical protein
MTNLYKVNGAWYINQLPDHLVIELVDGSLKMALMTKFKPLAKDDLKPYNGHHPRKCKGQPLPDYLYRFYGLERNEESLSEVIRVRVSPSERTKLEAYAANLEPSKTVSEVVRDYIRSL